MNEWLIYLVKVNVIILLFYVFYRILFYRDTFFRARRFLLLGMIVFAFTGPLLSFSSWFVEAEPVRNAVLMYVQPAFGELVVEAAPATANPPGWSGYLTVFYLTGTGFLLLRFIFRLFCIGRMARKGKKQYFSQCPVIQLEGNSAPFSFFHLVFVNPSLHSEKELEEILIHEHAHVFQWHSLDIMLIEVFTAVCWFNPFSWFIRREVRLNLEHLADVRVLRSGREAVSYQYHLLRLSQQVPVSLPVSYFNVSDFKRRIMMMNCEKSPGRSWCKYFLVIPFSLVLVTAVNGHTLVERMKDELTQRISNEPFSRIRGKVVNEKQLPLQGVSVVIKNSPAGTLTDENGAFSVEASSLDTLLFSYIGMTTQQIPLIGCQGIEIKVVLYPQAQELDPVIVVGYAGTPGENDRQAIGGAEGTEKPVEDDVVFSVVEEMPVFPGGQTALINYLAQHIRYPAGALQQKTEGRVLVGFVVNAEGRIENAEVKRGVDSLLDNEALRVIREMPRWQPGKQRGKAVSVMYVLPVTFRVRQHPSVHRIKASDALFRRNPTGIDKIVDQSGSVRVAGPPAMRILPLTEEDDRLIYIIDGRESTREEFQRLTADDVLTISVVKKESPEEETKAGIRATGRVIEVTTTQGKK